MGDRESDEERREESRRILEGVSRDSESLLLRSASSARDHFVARDAQGQDWTELWGRRIGRALALVFAVLLVFWLWSYFTGGGS